MTAQLPDHLVVVVAYHAVLRMESGELRTVIQQRPVRDQYPEGLPEKCALRNTALAYTPDFSCMERNFSHSSLSKRTITQCDLQLSLGCRPHLEPSAPFPLPFLFILHKDLVVCIKMCRTAASADTAQPGDRLPDSGEEAPPRMGQGRFRE